MLKYLRIAVTALSLTACVLVVALWVRSYWRWDSPHGPISRTRWMQLNSIRGYLFVGIGERDAIGYRQWTQRTFRASSLTDTGATGTVAWDFNWKVGALGFGVVESNQMRLLYMPYWFLAGLAAAAAAFCWSKQPRANARWRFSLRTLMVATTLVAVGLGLIALASK
jgi:hypothetical protein